MWPWRVGGWWGWPRCTGRKASHSLYVEARGRGVGKALLDHVSRVVDGPLSLKVQAPNGRAQAFYAREGFRCVERGQDPGSDVAWLRLVREHPAAS